MGLGYGLWNTSYGVRVVSYDVTVRFGFWVGVRVRVRVRVLG